MKRLKRIISALLCASLLLMPSFTSSAAVANPLTVDFARIANADSMLLGCNNSYMLVDTGNPGDAGKVNQMLNRRSVTALNSIVITHYDGDHVGGFPSVMGYAKAQRISIGKVYGRQYSKAQLTYLEKALSFPTKPPQAYRNYINFLNAISMYKSSSGTIPQLPLTARPDEVYNFSSSLKSSYSGFWVSPYKGQSFSLGGTTIEWLNESTSYLNSGTSGQNEPTSTTKDEINNDSLLFRATNGKSILFLGDICWNATKNLNALSNSTVKAEVVKLSHHGLEGSSKKSLLVDKVNPSYYIATTDNLDGRLKKLVDNPDCGVKKAGLFYTGTAVSYSTVTIGDTVTMSTDTNFIKY